jgi:ribosomal protein L11 methyltransferase
MFPPRSFLRFACPAEREEEIADRLVIAGSCGWQTVDRPGGWISFEADFASIDEPEVGELADWLRGELPGHPVEPFRCIPQPDWIAEAARGLEPFDVGRRLWVDPSVGGWPGEPPVGRFPLRIPPERAFGTGTHESTRLLLEALDECPPTGLSCLDVGTGSAILALACAGLGARFAAGFDVDAEAVFCARRNRLSAPPPAQQLRLFAGTLEGVRPEGRFDVVLANITPDVLVPMMPSLAGHLRRPGRLLLAGILREAAGPVEEAVTRQGLGLRPRRERGEWVALEAARE